MTAATANLINAAALIGLSLWAYFANGMSSETTLIPVAFGLLLLGHHVWLKAGSGVALGILILLTLIIVFALWTPLSGAIGKGEVLPIIRVGAMMATSVLALIVLARTAFSRIRAPKA